MLLLKFCKQFINLNTCTDMEVFSFFVLKVIWFRVKYLVHGFLMSIKFVGGILGYCELWLGGKSLKSQIFLFDIMLFVYRNTIYSYHCCKITVVILIRKIPVIDVLLSTNAYAMWLVTHWSTMSPAVIWP